ncbi:MAG TPA: MFS transporter, partial [Synergistaceae bacterium]|nr:MFS transporter [Synergistaceae bacterium]HQH79563.1 MFS transporter [Synergistaceae bacterium]
MGWRSLGSFFALNSSMVGLLTMVIFVGMGEKLAERFLPVYLMALGGGTLAVGLLNGLDNLLSALYSFPGGYVSDRLGTKRALVVFNLLAMGGFLVVILVPSWQAVILGSVLFLSWTSLSLPATMSLVAKVLPSNKRTMGVSMHSLFRRIPMALGPVVGGLCIDAFGEVAGVRWAFGGALVMAAVALGAQQRLIADDAADARKGSWSPPREMISLMDPALKNLLLADILVRFCEQIPYAFVVLWCMKDISSPVSAFQFGILTAVEMAVAMLI